MLDAFLIGVGSVVPLRRIPDFAPPRKNRSVARHFEKAGERIARSANREIANHVPAR